MHRDCGVGEGRRENWLCTHGSDRGGEGVLYHAAGEPGTGGKAADVGGNGVFYLHTGVRAHTGTVEGCES